MIFLDFGDFYKKMTRAEISRRMVRFSRRDLSYETDSGPKTKTVSDLNFQVTAATAAKAAAASQQLSHLARALHHHAQGPNIPFGVNPSLRLSLSCPRPHRACTYQWKLTGAAQPVGSSGE